MICLVTCIFAVLVQLSCAQHGMKVHERDSSLNHQNWVKCRYHSDCLNGGSCELDSNNELSCNCKAGWTGRDCSEDWVKCRYHSDCLNGGSCELDSINELSCKCKAGWTGRDCNVTCNNGKDCVCPEGWGGYHCDEEMTSIKTIEELNCENGVFIDGTCKCDYGFYGCNCNVFICSRGDCGDQGRCSEDSHRCECQQGWSGLFCEIDNWITFQRRMMFDIGFDKTFLEYEQGFGDVEGIGDFWLGLNKIHDYTKTGTWELRIDVVAFNESKFYSEYSGFKVLEAPAYNITWNAWTRGNLGKDTMHLFGLKQHKGAAFSAKDRNQDGWNIDADCPNLFGGVGWWFDGCATVMLNANRAENDMFWKIYWMPESKISLIGSTMRMLRVE